MKNLFILFALIYSGNIIAQTDRIVIDPALNGALWTTHSIQSSNLKEIKSNEDKIRNFQAIITKKMDDLKKLEEKYQKYLSTVNSVVKNSKDIKYCLELVKDIKKYQGQMFDMAVSDPKLLAIAYKTEVELVTRSVDLSMYIYQMALKGGDVMLDNKQRTDIILYVVDELRTMRGLAYSVARQMRYAKRGDFLQHLAPREFRYVRNTKKSIENILNTKF
ncbi:hypothetical protein [Capnocytophaga canis]|uniref:Plasmid transfer protein n=1 Tax=Capnocytophaga canis TaxID=1848903 RepID=A0A0B7IQE0_9FLAO|nr:hypothetical protein [Capnocytophaga canis]CEN52804.1 conserved exported hypothetical protein [Capnocytophaga canis]